MSLEDVLFQLSLERKRLDSVMQSLVINAVFAVMIESPYDRAETCPNCLEYGYCWWICPPSHKGMKCEKHRE